MSECMLEYLTMFVAILSALSSIHTRIYFVLAEFKLSGFKSRTKSNTAKYCVWYTNFSNLLHIICVIVHVD